MDHDCRFCGYPCDCGADSVENCASCTFCLVDESDDDDDYVDDVWGDDYSTPSTTFDDDGSDEGSD